MEKELILTLFETAGSTAISKEALSAAIEAIRPAFVKISAGWAKD